MRNYLIKLGFLSLLLLSCEMIPTITLVMDTPTINELSSAPNKENTPSPKSDLLSPNTFGTVDATTLKDKVIFGYQGWFGCPGDGSQVDDWFHWYRGPAAISNLTVDYWPDTSELTEEELCPTGMVDKRGKPLHAFSSYNQLTVLRHFYWMAENGIDGVELQRFATELIDPRYAEFRNKVTENVKFAAETYDRFFYIQYDGVERNTLNKIKQDWKYLVDTLLLTKSQQYMHHDSLPVVGIFGLGFKESDVTPAEALDLIKFFQENPEYRYRAQVLGGVPFFWRTLSGDSKSDPDWAAIYRSFNIISPWAVGRIYDENSADSLFKQEIKPDLVETSALGIDYMPVIYPGFSWSNLFPGEPSNSIPRNGGSFFWKQAYNLIEADVDMIYVAMFDEVDEGTAMFKLVASPEELPEGEVFVPLSVDGYNLPSDWYLRLGGLTGAMLRGEVLLTPEIPYLNDYYSVQDTLIELEIITATDWVNLEILNPEIVKTAEVTTTEGELTNYSASPDLITMNQSLANAQAGRTVTMHIKLVIDASADADALELVLKKGSINNALLVFYKTINGGDRVLIREVSHTLTSDDSSGQNSLWFSIPLE